ncbi:DUF6193 family natural product biosynthesis protein [Kitasatospora sp. NPDC097691]|uniref:DUF6193 family natural product biosynthesis protein n=1 Tax=Kitasatospora sp. NPDC097691 TaxID=3157231 RepID=UPI0033327D8E
MNFGVGIGERGQDETGAHRAVLRRAAEEQGLVLPETDSKWRHLVEYVDEEGLRRVAVEPPDRRRRTYRVDLSSHGTRLAWGRTSDPAKVATATAAWTGGAGLEGTRARASFVRFSPWALVHEREPLGAVELAWCLKLDRVHMPPYNRHPRVHALLAAAYAQPVLRRLRPVNSHFDLWFSTGVQRDGGVGFVVRPYDEGLYGVWHHSELVARTETPEEAVALVVAALPEELGPAS